ncbi:MAG: signal peptide peptidase SppA [Bacteroidota bacterium]|nr:signal peptide peptidase SppA [Bacteroidota bacterium]
MKDFFKYVGATIVGLLIFGLVVTMLATMSVVGMVASSESTQKVKENSVLVLNLEGILQEQADDNLTAKLNGTTGLGLAETLSAIKKAKDNENLKGIFIQAGVFYAYMAQVEEIRDALVDFKKSGKWIVAYGDTYSQACYYIASAANKIYLNPQGIVDWHGIGGQMTYLKDTYAKIGIKVIPFKCGKYKSATEMFTEDRMSEPNREQTERYIGGWWQTMCQAVSTSRGISIDTLNAYADRVVTLDDPKNLLKYKMVDGLLYADQVKPAIKKLLKIDEDKSINQVSVMGMQNVPVKNEGDEVAVYYAYGDIVTKSTPESIFGNHVIASEDVCKDLADLADDEDVKAVVIRVNSGGGSAFASEQIWHQVQELKSKKPVVISMGGAAASGGYYMSAGANYIYAEPNTITGSIGIFGLTVDRSELMTQKLGMHFDEVKTNRNALMGISVNPLTAEQMGYIQSSIDRGYLLFKSRVAQGRKMNMDKVEEIAQGHVYLGSDALKMGLVDALGGLDKAVVKAAQLAKLDTYYTESYPGTTSWYEQLMKDSEDSTNKLLDDKLKMYLGNFYEPFVLMQTASNQSGLQARMPFLLKVN